MATFDSYTESIRATGVAVWCYSRQEFVPFVPCPGERRVRLDVHDGLQNYGVYAVLYVEDALEFIVLSDRPLSWKKDLT